MTIYQCRLINICPTCKNETMCGVLFTSLDDEIISSHIYHYHKEARLISLEHSKTHMVEVKKCEN